jgi:osmotically-inducible protein OsmY
MKTDSQLQQDVSDELRWEPSVQATHIGVSVKDGVVTLAGRVDSCSEKWGAERAALRVYGVKALATELTVQLPGPSQRSDADIARSVENVLEWNSTVPAGTVKVKVEAGWVTLAGDVDWQYQRTAAIDSVRHLLGVVGVSDQISIEPALAASTVGSDIEAALRRAAIVDATRISVAVHGGDVTLAGTVRNFAEREAATNSAWATPGVRAVVDHMMLGG